MPRDVIAAIQAQNTQVAAGQIGALPAGDGQMLNATVTARSRLTTPEQFRSIIVKTQPDGSMVRLADVARVELGSESYSNISAPERPSRRRAWPCSSRRAPTRCGPPSWCSAEVERAVASFPARLPLRVPAATAPTSSSSRSRKSSRR